MQPYTSPSSLVILSLATLVRLVQAEVAPAGSRIIFQGLNNFCLLDEILSNVFVSGCSTTAGSSISWIVQNGGVASGVGPSGQIIFPDGNQCLTVDGAVADGTKLITDTCDASNPLQQWNVNGDSTITLDGTTKCVDLTNGDTNSGNPVQIWDCTAGDANQQWIPQPVPPPNGLAASSTVEFLLSEPTIQEDGCLTASSNADGATVVLQTCGDANSVQSQSWTLSAGSSFTGNGPTGTISTFGGSKCLDLTNGVSTNGNKLQVWTCSSGDANQLWQVNGDSTISWAGGNKCVDNTGGSISNGNQLQIWDCTAEDGNQQWFAEQSE